MLAAVTARIPYASATTDAAGAGWVSCGTLVSDADALATVVRGTMPGFGAADEEVAASLFVEAYAFRVAVGVLGAYTLGLPVPDPEAATVSVRVDKPRPTAVAYLDPVVRHANATTVAAGLVDGHLRPLVERIRERFVVGERLLRGNVAAACSVVFRALAATGSDRVSVIDRALQFHNACEGWFAGVGQYTVLHAGTREGWYWDRTSCCLWYRTEGGGYCDNCSLLDPDGIRQRRESELTAGPAPA